MYADWVANAPNFAGAYHIFVNYPINYIIISAFCFD